MVARRYDKKLGAYTYYRSFTCRIRKRTRKWILRSDEQSFRSDAWYHNGARIQLN